MKVSYLEHWIITPQGETLFTWVSDIPLTHHNVEALARLGRSRWKIENETFNTLKTQGYDLEHNYGHGQQHLATVLALLMMLAFLIDQVQELACRLFQAAHAYCQSRRRLWERLRACFTHFLIADWTALWRTLAQPPPAMSRVPDTS